ncbi:MAG: hypothetical protein HY301_06755 [Verrucomicrobia bacterium]|nr:hypothetical protein [Verrucomicrobiota bacterium]
MSFLDAILNLAALLLWVSWRTVGPVVNTAPVKSLTALLQPTDKSRRVPRLLLFLGALLLVRAVFYWQIGAPLGQTLGLSAGVTTVYFRCDYVGLMLIYSLLSFARTLLIFYLLLLPLSILNRDANDSEPCQRWVRFHLGAFERWPVWLQLTAVVLGIAAAWAALTPMFQALHLVPAAQKSGALALVVEQGFIVGVSALLVWKYLIVGLLLLHVLNNYIHFGEQPVWNYVSLTARNFLGLFAGLPLRAGRVDFAPLVVIVVVWLLAAWLGGDAWLGKSWAKYFHASLWSLPQAFQSLHP